MTNEEKVSWLNGMIEALDKKFNETEESQEMATGNNLKVHNTVANRMAARNKYRIERENLVKQRDEIEGPSPEVAAYIAGPKKVESKFDVEAGTAKVDLSLNPLGGKVI